MAHIGTIPYNQTILSVYSTNQGGVLRSIQTGLWDHVTIPARGYGTDSKRARLSANHLFFSKPVPIVSYVAGILASDGWVIWESENSAVLGLKMLDGPLVTYVHDILESQHAIGTRLTETGKIAYVLQIPSQILCRDLLKNYNITQNKSLTYTPPFWLNQWNSQSFCKGLFEGDGSVFINGKNNKVHCSFCGTYEVVTWFRDTVADWLDVKRNKVLLCNRAVADDHNYFVAWQSEQEALDIYWAFHDLDGVDFNGEKLSRHLKHPNSF